MENRNIRLAYRIVIDHQSPLTWDKYVFADTYREYLMQHQRFNDPNNPKPTFRELLAENPRAEQLHYLVGIAADSYVRQLNGRLHRVPDVLGNQFLPFTNYRLDIVNSDSADQTRHKIGLTFYSPLLRLVAVVNGCYLVSENLTSVDGQETVMFPVQQHLAICYVENDSAKNSTPD